MYVLYNKSTGKIIATYVYDEETIGPQRFKTNEIEVLRVPNDTKIDYKNHLVKDGKLVLIQSNKSYFSFSIQDIPSILFLSDDKDAPTGFGTQINNLYKGFKENKYLVESISWKDINTIPVRNFDYLITLGDVGLVDKITQFNIKNWYCWLVVDADAPYPDSFWKIAQKIPHIVAVTKTAQQGMLKRLRNVSYIPHGIDLDVFKPLSKQSRERYRKQNKLDNKFVIGYLGTNHIRKQIPKLLEAFELFAKDKEDVILIMKTKNEGKWNLSLLLGNMACKNKVRIYEEDFTPEGLNIWINMCDIGASATMAEGFGIPTIQFMANDIPMVIGDHTSSQELIERRLPLVKGEKIKGSDDYYRFEINVNDMSKKFFYYYQYWKTGIAQYNLRDIVEREYNISSIIEKWRKIIKNES